MDGGIMRIQSNGIQSSVDTATELAAAIRDLSGRAPIPALFDVRRWVGGDPRVWKAFLDNAMSAFSAVTFVADPESLPLLGGFPELTNRMLVPVEVFADEPEALTFLMSYKA